MINIFDLDKFPVIRQTESAECGLACIAMIANYYGYKTSLIELRRRFKITLKGVSAKDIVEIAQSLNFNYNAFAAPLNNNDKVEYETLSSLNAPAVLHWNNNHFVVLEKTKSNKIFIVDPSSGRLELDIDEFNKHFSGAVLEIFPSESIKKSPPPPQLKLTDLISGLKGLKKSLGIIVGLSILLQIAALITPLFLLLAVDKAILTNDYNLLIVLAFGFCLLVLITSLTQLVRGYSILQIGSMLSTTMALNIFRHLVRLPVEFFERRHMGDIISRFISLGEVKKFLTTGATEIVIDGLMMIGTMILMAIYSLKLTMIVIFATIIFYLFRRLQYPTLKKASHTAISDIAQEQSNFMETIRGITPIKLFSIENKRQHIWQNLFLRSLKSDIEVNKLKLKQTTTETLVFGFENVLVIYFGSLMVIENSISLGMLFAFIAYKLNFSNKAVGAIDKFIEFKMLSLHLERISDIALSDAEKTYEVIEQFTTNNDNIEIVAKDISFSYAFNDKPIFKNANIRFESGKTTAIIGDSSAGKSTLIKLIIGLLSPDNGEVLVDGKKINELNNQSFRKHIGTVMQDDILMSGSILENITFFDSNPDIDKAIICAKKAYIHESILRMTMKYDSLIGDMGSTLSGGERQRVLLARALYRNPKILVLDESTANLDRKTKQLVNQSIINLNATKIIVTHCSETVKMADVVYKVSEGKVKCLKK